MKIESPSPNRFLHPDPDDLPSPDELMPISQTLIPPDLALAFDIPSPAPTDPDQARTLKRPRLVWTPQLHKRFVDAVAHLGIKNAVPKTIMQLMGVDGLTRENVASHLQKYRLYLKRMQGLPTHVSRHDAATEQLFAAVPLPHPFLHVAQPRFLQQRHVQEGGFVRVRACQYGEEGERKALALFPTNE